MKSYIVISDRHFCWLVVIKHRQLFYVTISDSDIDDCLKIFEDVTPITDYEKQTIQELGFRLDNYSEKFFGIDYSWYETEDGH